MAAAERIARWMEERRAIVCWLDIWDILPGDPWQEDLERALEQSSAMLILISGAGFGPWQNEEARTAVDLRVRESDRRRVIPVLLPGADVTRSDFPLFLRRLSWLDMRAGISDETLERLAKAVTGEARRRVEADEPAPRQALPAALGQALLNTERSIQGTREWIRRVQNFDGGLPSDKEGSYSCAWTTAGLLWSVWEAGESFERLWMKRALTWVLDNINDDGGIPIVAHGDPSITDATAQTLLACAGSITDTSGERQIRAAETLVEWLVVHQENGAWSWRPSTEHCWTASTAFSLLALRSAQRIMIGNSAEVDEAVESGIRWLLATRGSDTGWGSYEGDSSRPAVTGLVTHVLSELGRRDEGRLSANYLLSEFTRLNRWATTIDRPYRHTVTRFGDAYGLLGLLSCADNLDFPEFYAGLDVLMRSFSYQHFQYEQSVMHTWPTRDGLLVLTQIARQLGSTVVR